VIRDAARFVPAITGLARSVIAPTKMEIAAENERCFSWLHDRERGRSGITMH
jgi:hypothetical protein